MSAPGTAQPIPAEVPLMADGEVTEKIGVFDPEESANILR
jgi:hypothetical protein